MDTVKVQLLVITPGIMTLRMERLRNTIVSGGDDAIPRAVRLCRLYAEDLMAKPVTIFDRSEVIAMGEQLFESELLLMLGVKQLALDGVNSVGSKVQKCLAQYALLRNRLLDDTKGEEYSGTIFNLPLDVKTAIFDKLADTYCY